MAGRWAGASPFTLDDDEPGEADLLGLGVAPVPAGQRQQQPAQQAQQRQQRQRHQQQQPQQQQPLLLDLLDAPLPPPAAAAGHGAPAAGGSHAAPPAQSAQPEPHDWQQQLFLQPQQQQPHAPLEVLSLRAGSSQLAPGVGPSAHRQGSLGYGERVWGGDEAWDHPPDAPDSADATRLLAAGRSGGSGGGGPGGPGGGGGGAPRGGRRGSRVEGVHGGDGHLAEDEASRTVQIITLGGEGVLTRWQRFLRAAGVRRRRPAGAYASNELVTAKYSPLSFVPTNLLHQFRRVANLYFAGLVCLQAIPGLSPVPWWGTLFPLAVVLTVNGVKEAFDDYGRHKADDQVNRRWVTTLREDGDTRVTWKALQVGDLVRLSNNEDVPADVALLGSSDPEGLCYVETANLDGETNLKVKFCAPPTAGFDCAEAFSRAGYFTIDCEAPNPRLYSFQGALCCWDLPPSHADTAASRAAALGRPQQRQQQVVQQQRQQQQRQQQQHVEVELSPAAGGGWYQQQQQQQQQQQAAPQQAALARRSGSPQRGGARHALQRPAAAAAGGGGGGGDSLTAALGHHGQPLGLLYREPLDASQLLLRGCTLRKTEWVIGAVVFTGPDTKVVRNMLPAPRKITRLESAMNRVVVVVLGLLASVAVACGTANMVWEARHSPGHAWYLGPQLGWPELPPGVLSWLVQVVRFVILLAQAVPISLYVSLEGVKVAQCKLLYDRDVAMYYAREDVPCTSRTTTLNEELGQVAYVLSDKTGTLTQNVMGFVWASIGARLYGATAHSQQAAAHAAARTQPQQPQQQQPQHAPGQEQQPGSGGGGGVVVGGRGSWDAAPPPNTPHTIALDPTLRGLAAGGAGAGPGGPGGSQPPQPPQAAAAAAAAAAVSDFLLALAVCNTVVPTATDEGRLLYQAASPDEEALVAGAAYLGTKLVSRSAAGVEVELAGRLQRLELLAVLEFSSDRKRMSVVVRQHEPQQAQAQQRGKASSAGSAGSRLRLISKGADNVMLQRLAGVSLPPGEAAAVQPLLAATRQHLAAMSGAGYRTLVVAAKDLDEAQFADWARRYKEAAAAPQQRGPRMDALAEELETGLTLLGATAVEDKLQEGVPESVAALSAAGIKVWVLTGDKMETAISIGHTARLLHQGMTIIKLREADLTAGAAAHASGNGASSAHQQQQQQSQQPPAPAAPGGGGTGGSSSAAVALALAALQARVRALKTGAPEPGAAAAAAAAQPDAEPGASRGAVALVVDGSALALALQPAHEDAFLAVARLADCVVCCRVSPMQKAQVATLLKRKAGAVTLAIGDGANDVSMIQAAHIGVGISGREGRAAVQASDFAFGQFRFLPRLLLLHGRQSYLRCREVVLYAFYKNVAYVACFVLYAALSGFSAQSLFFPLYIATFNALWAAFPTIGYGLMEQDVMGQVALQHPELYNETRCQTDADFYRAWLLWVLLGLWHGLACFFVPLTALARRAAVSSHGSHASVASLGSAVMTSVIITVTLRVAIRTSHWTVVNHALIWGTLALWLPFLALLAGLCGRVAGLAPLCGLDTELLAAPGFWLAAVFGAPAVALLPDLAILIFQRQFAPRASQLLQEVEAARAAAARRAARPPGRRRRWPWRRGAAALAVTESGAVAATAAQLPQQSPELQPQFRQQQQQQQQQMELPAQQRRPPQRGVIAVADVPPAAAGEGGGSMPSLLPGEQAAGDGWRRPGARGAASFSFGADYNAGGPHTLGDLAAAAGVEWAPDIITASPATLAASHTKRQSRMPLSRVRAEQPAGGGALTGASSTGSGGLLWRHGSAALRRLGSRTISGGSDAFGPAVDVPAARPAGAAQQPGAAAAAGAAPPPPGSPSAAALHQRHAAAPSRLAGGQARGPGSGGGAFTLGGDDTL